MSVLTADIVQLEEEIPKKGLPPAHFNFERVSDMTSESMISDIAAKDKGAALVRLAIEIEKEMVLLNQSLGLELRRPTWRALIEGLALKKILEPQLAKALIEFRDVRNKVIHSGLGGPIQDSLLNSTLDNGLQLLRMLKATAR